ncbi:MAG: glycosyltransferase family 2 protein [Armatimonadetes bacterium]|nr:glycosyltransferase family 2 protein [Armatimonadota bacterium]
MTLERPLIANEGDTRTPETPRTTSVLTVAVPVFNERETLLEIVRQVRGATLPAGVEREIILVDDGSTDGTTELLRSDVESRFADVRVLYHAQNRGKGAGIISAVAAAQGDFLVVQDADLEYDPNEFPLLLAPMLTGKADVVYGSRFLGKIAGMKGANLLANRLLTGATNLLFPGARITDEATCYKMFRLSVLRSFPLKAQRFDFCPEVTAKVLKRGYRIHEVPITYRARTEAQGKKIRWTDGVDALWTLLKYRFTD